MTSTNSRHVAIVGAGPGGAVLANLLATRGVRVTLLERQTDFSREFRGEGLAPSGVAVLRSLGMDEALEKVPQSVPSSMELYVNRRRMFRLDLEPGSTPGSRPVIVSQPALLEAIVAETQNRSDFVFERGASVKELFHEGSRVTGLRVRTPRGELRIDADLVIGCDGRSSVVRQQAPLEVESEDLPMDIVWCKLPAPPGWGGEVTAKVCVGHGHLFICYVAYDGLLQVAWIIPKGSYGELRKRGVDEWVDAMAHHVYPELSEHLGLHRDQLMHPFLLSTAADRVRRWSVPGAMVLGDAAHTMSPVGGQGINIALRDAVVAANHLVPVLRDGGSLEEIDAATRRIEAERLPEVSKIQALQAGPPKVILRKDWWVTPLLTLSGLMRIAPVRALVGKAAGPMLNGITDVTLRV